MSFGAFTAELKRWLYMLSGLHHEQFVDFDSEDGDDVRPGMSRVRTAWRLGAHPQHVANALIRENTVRKEQNR